MMLRRVLFALAFAALAAAASAQTGSDLLFFGVGSLGGGGGYGPLTPPSLTPQLSAAFDSNIANGYSNNGLKVNGGGAAGRWNSRRRRRTRSSTLSKARPTL
jgi:hypothetical protein